MQWRENRITRFLDKAWSDTTKFLKDNPDVMVSTSDKGSVTILSSKQDYFAKMNLLVHDQNSFTKLDRDPTAGVQEKNQVLIRDLCTQRYITKSDKRQLTTYAATTPRIYGQLKFRKPNLPLRPIVSTIGSAAYKSSRFLATILRKAFIQPKYNIKNSKQFVKKIRKTVITPGNVLVSFLVVNRFGNIPTSLAIQLIERDFHCISPHTDIPKYEFISFFGSVWMRLTILATKENSTDKNWSCSWAHHWPQSLWNGSSKRR